MKKATLRQELVAIMASICLMLGLTGCKSVIPTLAPTLDGKTPTPAPSLEEVEIVAWVNQEPISGEQFEKRVKYERLTLVQTFLNYQLSEYASLFQSQLLQLQYQLDDANLFASDILNRMAWEMTIVQKAKELGITVSEQEVDRDIEQNFGYFPEGTPTPATIDLKPTSTYSPTQLALVTPAVSQPTLTPLPTVAQPTPTAYTYESFKALYDAVILNLANQTQFGDSDFRSYRSSVLYQQKLYEMVTKDVPGEQDMVWARHILVGTEAEATEILRRLNAGEKFPTLATLYSIDSGSASSGGDLEWFIKGQMVEDFETAAWVLPIGQFSQPVKTDFGYHIIQVLGHETRQLSAEQLSIAKSTVYKAYIDQLQAGAEIKILDNWKEFVPTEPVIPVNYKILIQPTLEATLQLTPQP